MIPARRADKRYKILRRVWADKTMNVIRQTPQGWKHASNRGSYVEGHEDYMTIALFEIWAAFPDAQWAERLLDAWGIAHGLVTRVNWSYEWAQRSVDRKAWDIADIVLCWEDDQGQGVVVIEAKRPGGKLTEKDLAGGLRYLDVQGLKPFGRKHVHYLVAEKDIPPARSRLPPGTPLSSWEDLGRLQISLIQAAEGNLQGMRLAAAYTAIHYSQLGVPTGSLVDECEMPSMQLFDGGEERYAIIRSMQMPETIERYLVSSEVMFCARRGIMPTAPFSWLSDEPGLADVDGLAQTTPERTAVLWELRESLW
jgi:hypothetical protein